MTSVIVVRHPGIDLRDDVADGPAAFGAPIHLFVWDEAIHGGHHHGESLQLRQFNLENLPKFEPCHPRLAVDRGA